MMKAGKKKNVQDPKILLVSMAQCPHRFCLSGDSFDFCSWSKREVGFSRSALVTEVDWGSTSVRIILPVPVISSRNRLLRIFTSKIPPLNLSEFNWAFIYQAKEAGT